MANRLAYDKAHAEEQLLATVLALRSGIQVAATELAAIYGTDDLDWFKTFRRKALQAAKKAVAEDTGLPIDATARKFGLQVLDKDIEDLCVSMVEGNFS